MVTHLIQYLVMYWFFFLKHRQLSQTKTHNELDFNFDFEIFAHDVQFTFFAALNSSYLHVRDRLNSKATILGAQHWKNLSTEVLYMHNLWMEIFLTIEIFSALWVPSLRLLPTLLWNPLRFIGLMIPMLIWTSNACAMILQTMATMYSLHQH